MSIEKLRTIGQTILRDDNRIVGPEANQYLKGAGNMFVSPEETREVHDFFDTNYSKMDDQARSAFVNWITRHEGHAPAIPSPTPTPTPTPPTPTPPAPTPSEPGTVPAKRGHKVYFAPERGFAIDKAGTLPSTPAELTAELYEAGNWLQASFGTRDNLFTAANLSPKGKAAVLAQFEGAVSASLEELKPNQRDQLLGSICALTAEMLKSLSSSGRPEEQPLKAQAFAILSKVLGDDRLSVLARRSLVGYFVRADSFQACLTPPQKAELQKFYARFCPTRPFDYEKWDARGKSLVKIDHVCGQGEGFLYGFVKECTENGLGDVRGRYPNLKWQVVSGDVVNGPCVLRVKVPASDPMNTWGREMTFEMDVRMDQANRYARMGDESYDISNSGSHADFGSFTLASLKSAPPQRGEKVILRFLCCGADTANAEARVYPEASLNSITTICSGFFRRGNDPRVGEYAKETEDFLGEMVLLRNILQKNGWDQIGADLERYANWGGHDTNNNWTWPTDPRAGSFLDSDDDGIPNVFDLLPSYDTISPQTSVSREFDLRIPEVPAGQLSGATAFQAIQFLNTATNYNTELQPFNPARKVTADPQGIWFEGAEDSSTYARFRKGDDGRTYVQLNSALSGLSLESMRTVLYVEFVRFTAAQSPRAFGSKEEQNAMALLFATSSLQFDQSSRDAPVFEGLLKLYGFPESLDYRVFARAVGGCEERHNYTGDTEAVRDLLGRYRGELARGGDPALPAR